MVGKFSISRLNEKKTNGKMVNLVFAETKAKVKKTKELFFVNARKNTI